VPRNDGEINSEMIRQLADRMTKKIQITLTFSAIRQLAEADKKRT